MADSKRANEAEMLDTQYDRLRTKFFGLYPKGEIHPDNQDVKNKVKIVVFTNAVDTDTRSFSGYSGSTNLIEAQKEATIQAFKHMGLDLEAVMPGK